MKKQYFISGLGADEKAFQNLEDFGTKKVMVKWLDNNPDESLANYSKRIIEKYNITSEDILVGLSFGGLIVQQIAEILNVNYVILISSFRNKSDLKPIFHNGLNLKLHRLMPEIKTPLISEIVANYLNSGSKLSKPILKKMIETTNLKLMKWSIEKIYEQKLELCKSIIKYNLIGSSDRIVKPWENGNTFIIENGSHFMVFDKAEEVSKIISKIIDSKIHA